MDEIKVWGLPGTGKTTFGVNYARNNNFFGEDICAETYRRQLASDFKNKLGGDNLRLCGTTHAVCKRLLDAKNVAQSRDRGEFCKDIMKINCSQNSGNRLLEVIGEKEPLGDAMFNIRKWLIENMKRSKDWSEAPGADRRGDLNTLFVREFNMGWDDYMDEKGLIDFDNMLRRVYRERVGIDVKYYFSDEFQDKTPLQYEIHKMWRKGAENVVVAGDPLQTIYSFGGANPLFFEELGGDVEVLHDSWRLAPSNWEFAKTILIDAGFDDIPELNAKGKGSIKEVGASEVWSLLDKLRYSEVFLLVRAKYMMQKIMRMLEDLGIPFMSAIERTGWTEKQMTLYNILNKLRNYKAETDRAALMPMWVGDSLTKEELDVMQNVFHEEVFSIPKTKVKGLREGTFGSRTIQEIIQWDFIKSITQGKIPDGCWNKRFDRGITRVANALLQHADSIEKHPVMGVSPRVYVGTIHSAKGREADNVLLFDNTTYRLVREAREEDEARVFFVGATRAKQNNFIVRNFFETECYPLPYTNPVSNKSYFGPTGPDDYD